jgi:tetratricopeptide (TPR) repeat protein
MGGIMVASGSTGQGADPARPAGDLSQQGLPDFDRLWDYDHPDSTEQRFREILPAARASQDAGYLVQLLTQLARCQGLQRRFPEAHATLDEAEAHLRADLVRARVRYLLERGRVYNSSGDPDQARPLFQDGWDLARFGSEDALAVDAAHMLAIVDSGSAAIEWNRRAMSLAESSSDPKARKWLGSLYNNLGWTYHDQGDYAVALDLFEKAYDLRVEQKQPKETRIARWCVARTLRSLGRTDEALRIQQELAKEWEAAGEEDGYVFEELGECLLALGRQEEARPDFARAYELLSKDPWLQEKEGPRLRRLAELGGLATQE